MSEGTGDLVLWTSRRRRVGAARECREVASGRNDGHRACYGATVPAKLPVLRRGRPRGRSHCAFGLTGLGMVGAGWLETLGSRSAPTALVRMCSDATCFDVFTSSVSMARNVNI
jgi:hypothetical protein